MVKFSIITVCLNSERTINRCLDSVANQTFKDFEHIIIDGISSDNTLDLIKKYKVDLCVSEKDKGIYDAMNKGVSYSQGEFVLFLNSDDELLPDFLQECSKMIKENDFVSSGINMVFMEKISKWVAKPLNNTKFIWRMPMPHAGLIVKTKVFNEIGGFDLNFKITSDFDFIVKLLKGNYLGGYNKKCFFNFYMGGISQSYNSVEENHKVRLKHFDNFGLIYLAYLMDNLRFIKYKLDYLVGKN